MIQLSCQPVNSPRSQVPNTLDRAVGSRSSPRLVQDRVVIHVHLADPGIGLTILTYTFLTLVRTELNSLASTSVSSFIARFLDVHKHPSFQSHSIDPISSPRTTVSPLFREPPVAPHVAPQHLSLARRHRNTKPCEAGLDCNLDQVSRLAARLSSTPFSLGQRYGICCRSAELVVWNATLFDQLLRAEGYGVCSPREKKRVRTKASERHPGTGVCSDHFCGPAEMFGHPGISALEFAGEHQKAGKILSLKGKAVSITTTTTTTLTSERVSKSSGDQHIAEFTSPQPSIRPEEISLRRRRRTFMNHTPRNFEMRSPKSTEFPQTIETDSERYNSMKGSDEALRPGTSHQLARGQTASPTSEEQTHHSALVILMANNSAELNTNAPVELDSKEVVPDMAGKSSPKNPASRRNSFTSSLASRVTGRASTVYSSQEIHPHTLVKRRQLSEKRRRRQTPYKIVTSSPKSINSRFSPLEPWVAHHRGQETSSTIGELPPQLEIGDIAEVSTFSAIQEYFDSQVSARSAESTIRRRSSSLPDIPLPSSPVETRISGPPVEPTAVFPADELEIFREPIPDLPPRSPARLHTANRVRSKTVDADFESAAEGQYSPYDKPDALTIPKYHGRRESVRPRQAERTGSSTLGRMAPPVLGHAALTATADLNDLSFYLKNTGPPSDGGNTRKKPALKKIFKVPRKKSLAVRVGSVEGHSSKNNQHPLLACAREMRTASGARHLRIIVPTDTLSYDHTIMLPVSLSNCRSRNVSITWTDEMLNPLASPGLEHAILDFNSMGEEFPGPSITPRTSRRSPMTLTPVPVEDHPLKSREEKTKARKLRDLKKMKRDTANTTTSTSTAEDTTAGALATLDQPPVQMCGLPVDNTDERQEERPLSNMVKLQHRATLLQRQNTELAEALARMMGLDMEDGELEADVVLKTYNRLRFSRGTEWDDLVMSRN